MKIAVDMLKVAHRIDHFVMFVGQSRYADLIEGVQEMGASVTVVFPRGSTSNALRRLADDFVDIDLGQPFQEVIQKEVPSYGVA